MQQTQWDERYAAADAVWSGQVNPTLVAQVTNLSPGRVLEVAAGEGADAIWLAEAGWQVTALDFSTVALERARQAAAARGVGEQIEFLHADLNQWEPGDTEFDLVTVHFLQITEPDRSLIYRKLGDAVAVGGRLLVVGHHPLDIDNGLRRPRDPDRFFTASQIAAIFDATWEVEVDLAAPRQITDAEGNTATAHDAVLVLCRQA